MGRIQSDFPLPQDANGRPRRLDRSLGSGGAPIHITTGNGSIAQNRNRKSRPRSYSGLRRRAQGTNHKITLGFVQVALRHEVAQMAGTDLTVGDGLRILTRRWRSSIVPAVRGERSVRVCCTRSSLCSCRGWPWHNAAAIRRNALAFAGVIQQSPASLRVHDLIQEKAHRSTLRRQGGS
jgi:hypothetical protein